MKTTEAREAQRRKMKKAIEVLILTPHTRAFLEQHDPKALEQARDAIGYKAPAPPKPRDPLADQTFNLTVSWDKVRIVFRTEDLGKTSKEIRSANHLRQFLAAKAGAYGVKPGTLQVTLSPTMHNPEDVTNDPETIALAKAIAG